MTQSFHNDRLAPLPFFLLMASVFAVYVGYGIVLPVLPFLLERLLDDGARFSLAWHTGMVAGLYMLALFVAGSGILIPMLAYRISLQADNAQGAALGKQTAAASLGQGLGSVTAGWLFGLALQAPFLATAALMLAGALIGWRSGRG
jgi:hypothetical protein